MTDTEAPGANICHLQLGMAVTLVLINHGEDASLLSFCSGGSAQNTAAKSGAVSNRLAEKQPHFCLYSVQKQ